MTRQLYRPLLIEPRIIGGESPSAPSVILGRAGTVDVGHVVALTSDGVPVDADSSTVEHADRVIGISVGGGTLAVSGEVEMQSSEVFIPGQILWIGPGGLVTGDPPEQGFQQQIAVAVSSSRGVIVIKSALLLA